jgi:hypothetical protein
MKPTYLWIALGLAAAWYFLLRKPAATSNAQGIANSVGASPSVDPTTAKAVATQAFANWGIAGGITVTQADQTAYPGWYTTSDGGWVNLDSGATVSPGGSPPALDMTNTYYGNVARPDFSSALIMPDTTTSQPADEATSPNNPANGYIVY